MTFSPDGHEYIIKDEKARGASDLLLLSFPSGQQIARLETDGFPLLIEWRPGSKEISYVMDEHGDRKYKLHLWNTASGKTTVLNSPILVSANRLMHWSDDGLRLAFCLGKDPDELWTLDMRGKPSFANLPISGTFLDYKWSPDGKRLAAVMKDNEGELHLWSEGAKSASILQLAPGEEIQAVNWMPDNARLVYTTRNAEKKEYSLCTADAVTGAAERLDTSAQRIVAPVALSTGDIVVHTEGGGTKGAAYRPANGRLQSLGFDDSILRFIAHDPAKNELLLDYTGLTEPRAVYRKPLSGGEAERVFQLGKLGDFAKVRPQRVMVKPRGAQGKPFPIQVWRSPKGASKGAVIRFPIRHGANEEITFSGARQFILDAGYDFVWFDLALDSRAKGGVISEAYVPHTLAVIDYARHELKHPASRLVLFGESDGSMLVGRTLVEMEEKAGGLVFRGLLREFSQFNVGANDFRIGLIQGENDTFCSPGEAKSVVNQVFGDKRMEDPRCIFLELEGEGHMPRSAESRATTAAVMLQLLEGAP